MSRRLRCHLLRSDGPWTQGSAIPCGWFRHSPERVAEAPPLSSRQPGLDSAALRTLMALRGQVVLVHGDCLDVQCVEQCLHQPPWPSPCPFPSTGDSSSLWPGPPNSTSLPWCMAWSTIAAASLSSAETVPYLPDLTFIVNAGPSSRGPRISPGTAASPRPHRRAHGRTRPGPAASPWQRRRAACPACHRAWPCPTAARAGLSARTSPLPLPRYLLLAAPRVVLNRLAAGVVALLVAQSHVDPHRGVPMLAPVPAVVVEPGACRPLVRVERIACRLPHPRQLRRKVDHPRVLPGRLAWRPRRAARLTRPARSPWPSCVCPLPSPR